MSLRDYVPWWGRIAAKIVLSRLGIPNTAYHKLGLFRHGPMDSPTYVRAVFNAHVARAGLTGSLAGKTLVEIGPGEGLGTALLAYAYGAHAILIDTGHQAGPDLRPYQLLSEALAREGLPAPKIDLAGGVEGILEACNTRYLTHGLESWADLPDASIDLIFSQAVLEHVRLHEFRPLLQECRRVLKPGGICSHRIDLQDHLGGGLNNLRFPKKLWESGLFSESGFYTNRIRYHQMLALFEDTGFQVTVSNLQRWDALPINRQHLAPEFGDIPDDELCISGFDVMLRCQ